MMCIIADQLRREWYAVCLQLVHPPYLDERSKMAICDQQGDYKYQRALWRLRNHIQDCEFCRNGHETAVSAN
jgi:hypothetical protein